MKTKDLIQAIAEAKLLGRSGSGFPTSRKWDMVRHAAGRHKYVVCNASEGEPGVFKDGYILEHFPDDVIDGIRIAIKTVGAAESYVYLREDYFDRFQNSLMKAIRKEPITLFRKTGGYLAGEETTVCAEIEGRFPEPQVRPPYPAESGIHGCPTLVNNVETLYDVARIVRGTYNGSRLYSVSGDIPKPGVYELPETASVRNVLKQSQSTLPRSFFVQVGGGASGEVLLPDELEQPVGGAGAVIVYDREQTDPFLLMEKWSQFFMEANCDRCPPCREGVFRIAEMVKRRKIDSTVLDDLFFVLQKTSFCALGKGVVPPFKSLMTKVLYDKG